MSLHKIAVSLGLTYATDKDAETRLAKYISLKFQEAVTIFIKENFSTGKKEEKTTFVSCLKQVWLENNGRRRKVEFYVHDPYLLKHFPDLCGVERRIIMIPKAHSGTFAETYHGPSGDYQGMQYSMGSVDSASNTLELKKVFLRLVANVYHECDHIYSQGKSENEGVESSLLYLMDKGELRAHSKELAFLFHHAYEGKRFNYKLLLSHIQKAYARNEKPFSVVMHLELFRDPENFKSENKKMMDYLKNRVIVSGHRISVGDCKKVFRAYMHFITHYVEYFNKHPGHKIKVNFDLR